MHGQQNIKGFFTVYNKFRKSHHQPQCNLQLVCKDSKSSRFKQLRLGNHSELHKCLYELFFPHNLAFIDIVTSQNNELSS